MANSILRILVGCLLFVAAGCASIVDGRSQAVTFNSQPDGAEIIHNGVKLSLTPFSTILKRQEDQIVIARKEGYEDQNVNLTTRMNYWFWGNILLGGLIGSTTDVASGAYIEYEPDKYFINLVPKKTSQSERDLLRKRMWARNFILVAYPHLERDLAVGHGEYLSSLCSILGIEETKKEESYQVLRKLMAQHRQDVPSFARSVLKEFQWE